MLHNDLLLVLGLLFLMCFLYILSRWIGVSYPIFLVLGGLLIGLVPGMPAIQIEPEIIFLIFLPPLLYEAAWFTSWYDFWRWKRPILFLGFVMVMVTSVAVAVFADSYIPGFTLALGFLLGGIVSPPDAVAATSVLKGQSLPRRFTTILEGESLVNDAASLIVFRFAVAAVITGQFTLQKAVTDFFIVSFFGITIGISVAALIYVIQKWLPTTASLDTVFTLMTPYVLYLTAEHFHVSGVLAVVSGGLFLSFRSNDLLNFESRLQATNVWAALIFVLNGLVFILIGLELPTIVAGLGNYSLKLAILYGLMISGITIVTRIATVLLVGLLPNLVPRFYKDGRKAPMGIMLLTGWAGMRGVVSLASALAIPLLLTNGKAFPQRNLIIFITFVVILVTLVVQGLSIPYLVKLLGIKEIDETIPHERQLAELRLRTAESELSLIDERFHEDVKTIPRLRRYVEQLLLVVDRETRVLQDDTGYEEVEKTRRRFREIYVELVNAKRRQLLLIRREKKYDEEVLREFQNSLDLEEARIRSTFS